MAGEITLINELKRQDGDELPVVDKSRVRGLLDALAALLPKSLFGQPLGVAGLDANGKLRRAQMPDFMLGNLYWAGDYDFDTDQVTWSDPTQSGQAFPAASDTNSGQYFIAIGSGTLNGYDYNTGDWIVSYGTAVGYRRVDNTDAVQSVAGRTGAVTLSKKDVGLDDTNALPEGTSNLYFTEARARAALASQLAGKADLVNGVVPILRVMDLATAQNSIAPAAGLVRGYSYIILGPWNGGSANQGVGLLAISGNTFSPWGTVSGDIAVPVIVNVKAGTYVALPDLLAAKASLVGGKVLPSQTPYLGFTPATIKTAVSTGTFAGGELQGGQPIGSNSGMEFFDSQHFYKYQLRVNDTDGSAFVWVRWLKELNVQSTET